MMNLFSPYLSNRVLKCINEFYKETYRNYLGLESPLDGRQYDDYGRGGVLDIVNRNIWSPEVRGRLVEYEKEVSPASKTLPLLEFIMMHGLDGIKSLLDYGCGHGNVLRYLCRKVLSLERANGVDVVERVLPTNRVEKMGRCELGWGTNLMNASEHLNGFDIILLVHVLHHVAVPDREPLLRGLKKLLSIDGVLYVYEDSWSANRMNSVTLSKYDSVFIELGLQEKNVMYRINDIVSNVVCHHSMQSMPSTSYSPVETWSRLFERAGYELISSGLRGFDTGRLHGVPSGWLILKDRKAKRGK